MAEKMNVHFLGSLPFDPRVVQAGDVGESLLDGSQDSLFVKALNQLISEVDSRCSVASPETAMPIKGPGSN